MGEDGLELVHEQRIDKHGSFSQSEILGTVYSDTKVGLKCLIGQFYYRPVK